MDFDLNVALGLFDLEECDVENGTGTSDRFDDIEADKCDNNSGDKHQEDCNDLESLSIDFEQKLTVGSVVRDVEELYLLYCEYARCKGFGVRRGAQRYVGTTTELRWKEFKCSCAGHPDCKSSKSRVAAYKKLITRTNCKAKIRVSRVINGPWRIKLFETLHNHALVSIDQTYLLRSARNLSHAKQAILQGMHSVGIGVSQACDFLERECGGPQNVGFTRKDAYDHIRRTKRSTTIENGDANALLDYFIHKSNTESSFFWKFERDDEGCLMNFFFRDSRCAHDYAAFGDILSLDTTYRTNRYHLICAPFVGINHHANNVMFGMAFLSDETTSSFEWLFDAFLESMGGKQPKVIYSDQCKVMMNAIDTKFTNAKHRLCQWHINQNAPSHFGPLNGNSIFKSQWYKCMNHVDDEEEFGELWGQMIQEHDLSENTWFQKMFELRHRWADVFTRDIFIAGLKATSRSEVTNKVIKGIGGSRGSLYDFICGYEQIQMRWRSKEQAEDTFCLWLPGQFVSNNALLTHAATIYTRSVFASFQYEVTESLNVIIDANHRDLGDENLEYEALTCKLSSHKRKIVFNKITKHASCTCGMRESEGLFCRHILKVYYIWNVDAIPEAFILKRWTKKAKEDVHFGVSVNEISGTLPYMTFVNILMRKVNDIACLAKDCVHAQDLIQEQVDALLQSVLAIVGDTVKIGKKRNAINTDCEKFLDPKKVKERGFVNARLSRHWETNERKGKKMQKKKHQAPPYKPRKRTKREEELSKTPKTYNFMDAHLCRGTHDTSANE